MPATAAAGTATDRVGFHAAELSVSVNTVNTHVRRIYAKLGADDRSAAVHHARKLQLLSAGRKH